MELWYLYDENRIKLGQTMVRGDKQPDGVYRIVVHACIFNSDGKMLIQQRQPFKSGWSDMWDVTVGGSAVSGDTSQTAVERELLEEIGLVTSFKGIMPALTVNVDGVFDDFYIAVRDDIDISTLKLQYSEVKEVKWATRDEILAMIKEGSFIPYHDSFIDLLFFMRTNFGVRTGDDTTLPSAQYAKRRH